MRLFGAFPSFGFVADADCSPVSKFSRAESGVFCEDVSKGAESFRDFNRLSTGEGLVLRFEALGSTRCPFCWRLRVGFCVLSRFTSVVSHAASQVNSLYL